MNRCGVLANLVNLLNTNRSKLSFRLRKNSIDRKNSSKRNNKERNMSKNSSNMQLTRNISLKSRLKNKQKAITRMLIRGL